MPRWPKRPASPATCRSIRSIPRLCCATAFAGRVAAKSNSQRDADRGRGEPAHPVPGNSTFRRRAGQHRPGRIAGGKRQLSGRRRRPRGQRADDFRRHRPRASSTDSAASLSTFPGHVTSFIFKLKHDSGRKRTVSVDLLGVAETDEGQKSSSCATWPGKTQRAAQVASQIAVEKSAERCRKWN